MSTAMYYQMRRLELDLAAAERLREVEWATNIRIDLLPLQAQADVELNALIKLAKTNQPERRSQC